MQRMEISAPDFDLEKTLDSGQVFHWEKIGKAFVGTIGEWAVCTEQRGEVLCARVASPSRRSLGRDAQDADATIFNYFALDHPLADICASFPDDPVMNAARQFCRGLRIIRLTRFRWLSVLPVLLRRICANAHWAIAPKICSRLRDSSAQAKRTWKHGRLCPMPISKRSCVRYRVWERRLPTV